MWKLIVRHLILLTCLYFTVSTSASAQIKADFSSNITDGCAPLVVRFKDESTGNPTSWKWDLGNGTISYFQNPAATYFNPGTYTVKLVVSNGSQSDSIIKTKYITVYALPVVNFVSSDTTGCYPLTVQLTDLTTPGDGSITKWLWDFGDGATDTVQNPSHVYNALGNYNVSLQATNSFGCVSTLTRPNYIKLANGVKSGFTFTAPNSCRPPTPITFTNLSTGTGILNYQWNFGDGGTSTARNPVHIYNTPGSYTVTLITRNNTGCVDSMTLTQGIIIGNVTAAFSSPDTVCAGVSFQLLNASSPTPSGAFWSFGDGSFSNEMDPRKIYAGPGNFQIKLVSDFGACKDSTVRPIHVLPKPVAAFSATNTTACKPALTTNFTSAVPAAVSYKWFFGDGDSSTLQNPSHTYSVAGDFDVTLIVTNAAGCADTLVKRDFVIIRAPQVTISNLPQEGCIPYMYQGALNIQSVDSIVSYQWDFGDGGTGSGPNPVHTYTVAGHYQVRVIITTAGGCTDTIIQSGIKVGVRPLPAFGATPRIACAFQPIRFSDLSTGAPIDNWLWHFGDGGTSTDQHPTYFYQDTGYFNVKLIVWNNGCRDSLTINNYIQIRPPIARFIDSSWCIDKLSRKFIDRSLGATYWFWDFGDGSTSTDQNPTHTFPAAGTYTVILTVRNDTCEHTTQQQVKVVSEKADFIASDSVICKGTSVQFSTKNINTANIAMHDWDFGDGVRSSGSNSIAHTYTVSGNYTVTLIITDVNGCRDTLIKPLYIHVDGPTADFRSSIPGACLDATVTFIDSSKSDGTHAIQQWIWNYGDGTKDTLSGPPFTHTYSSAGNYAVTLTVIDSKGCVDSLVATNAIIISSPKAGFTSLDTLTCTNKNVRFINSSTGPALQYRWEFGDTQTSSAIHPVHSFSSEGYYSIKLLIEDQYGCKDSIIRSNYIHVQNPVAQFSMSDSVGTCPPLVVNFTNQSQHFISHEWDFGDGTKSSIANPVHFYTYPGTYRAKLTVVSVGGCVDTLVRTIIVRGPQGSFVYDKNFGCVPTTIRFVATTKDQVSFIWDFNDGETTLTNDSLISHTYTQPGDYLPKMILRDPGGCQVPILGTDTIHIYGVKANLTMSQQIVCDSGRVFFRDSSLSNDLITNYQWTLGDGATSSLQNPSHVYTTPGNYPIRLIVSTQHGCKDTTDNIAPLKLVSSPVAAISGDTASCVPAILDFAGMVLNPDTSALRWQWDFGNNTTSPLQNPQPVTYSDPGNYNVRLVLTNSSNCADTVNFPVVAYPLPAIDAGNNRVICRDESVILQATGAVRYTWMPGPALSCTDCASPTVRPDSTYRYMVQGENNFGCMAVDSVLITVKQPFSIKAGSGDTLCKGETYSLSVTGAELYNWSPVIGLDDPTSANPKAKPDTTILYRVIGRDDQNCFADTAFVPVVVYPYPLVEAGKDQTISVGSSITLAPVMSQDVKVIRWTPDKWLSCNNCPAPVASPKQTTRYLVEVRNQGGCITRDDITVFVICEQGNLYMPNTFSPNGDGINDVFYPRGKGIHGIKNFRVFDRWGEVVFEMANFQANDISKGWNGSFRGKLASQDVYVYTIDVICENNEVFSFKGNIALIR